MYIVCIVVDNEACILIVVFIVEEIHFLLNALQTDSISEHIAVQYVNLSVSYLVVCEL
jgi:hypothetical protein